MENFRFQFAALPAKACFVQLPPVTYVKKSRISILKLRFNVSGIINAGTGEDRIRVKSFVFSLTYFDFSEKSKTASFINFFSSAIIAAFASAIGLFFVYHFLIFQS